MAARAIWKGLLHVGSEQLGVKLYSAVEDHQIRFNLLHEKDKVRVKQRLVHSETGETVTSDDLVRAVEVEPGVFVKLDEKDLASVEPEPSRDIEILRFVPDEKLGHRWYDRPYYLGPDDGGIERYFALVEALQRSGREGVARWSMRKRDYLGALRVHEGHLALVALHFAEQVVAFDELPAPSGRAIEDRERKLARQLIDTLTAKFDPAEFRDEYRDRVAELIEDKRKGKRVKLTRFKAKPVKEESLADILQKSLRRAA
jgi:DNA end-binding protein Ku